jgi:4-alpha-glucanotransferase
MDKQAGAPPDDFAEKGQNWGFPTYNWARMKEDDFAWWKQRFAQMRLYFDAFRIDHILGFFRIWSIPMHAVEGIMGYFVPAIPITEREFHDAGIGFNFDRLCKPFITDQVLMEQFGEMAELVVGNFLEPIPDAGRWSGASQYIFKAEFDTQRKVLAFLEAQPLAVVAQEENEKKPAKKAKTKAVDPVSEATPIGLGLNEQETEQLKKGLFNLLSNVILFADDNKANAYHFRFGIDKTSAFRSLPPEVREKLNAIYVNYFFRRQDEFLANRGHGKTACPQTVDQHAHLWRRFGARTCLRTRCDARPGHFEFGNPTDAQSIGQYLLPPERRAVFIGRNPFHPRYEHHSRLVGRKPEFVTAFLQ